jgi:hypothetical protein
VGIFGAESGEGREAGELAEGKNKAILLNNPTK